MRKIAFLALALAGCGDAWTGTSGSRSSNWTWVCGNGAPAPDSGCPKFDAGADAPDDNDDSLTLDAGE